jgi:hypothetical protein
MSTFFFADVNLDFVGVCSGSTLFLVKTFSFFLQIYIRGSQICLIKGIINLYEGIPSTCTKAKIRVRDPIMIMIIKEIQEANKA